MVVNAVFSARIRSKDTMCTNVRPKRGCLQYDKITEFRERKTLSRQERLPTIGNIHHVSRSRISRCRTSLRGHAGNFPTEKRLLTQERRRHTRSTSALPHPGRGPIYFKIFWRSATLKGYRRRRLRCHANCVRRYVRLDTHERERAAWKEYNKRIYREISEKGDV